MQAETLPDEELLPQNSLDMIISSDPVSEETQMANAMASFKLIHSNIYPDELIKKVSTELKWYDRMWVLFECVPGSALSITHQLSLSVTFMVN